MPALLLAVVLTAPAAPPIPQDAAMAASAAAGVREVIGHIGSCADQPGNTLAEVRKLDAVVRFSPEARQIGLLTSRRS
jgi:hypothetical protein